MDLFNTLMEPFLNSENAWDKFKNGRTNEMNMVMNEQNLQFQRENLDYQKALQQQIFAREDTSYQRTVEDLRNAGLSPLTMSGTNGSGSPIATQAPQNTNSWADVGLGTMLSELSEIVSASQQAIGSQASARKTNAEAQLLEDTHDANVRSANSRSWSDRFNEEVNFFNSRNAEHDYNYLRSRDYTNSMSDVDRRMKDFSRFANGNHFSTETYHGNGLSSSFKYYEDSPIKQALDGGKDFVKSLPEFGSYLKNSAKELADEFRPRFFKGKK